MKYKFLILFLVIFSINYVYATDPLKWICKTPLSENYSLEDLESEETCKLMDMQTKPPILVREMERGYAVKLEITYPSISLAEMRMSCGTSCSVTSFYNLTTHKLSNAFGDVLSVDPQRKLVVSMGDNGVVLNAIFNPSNQGEVLLLKYEELSSAEELINSNYENTAYFEGEYLFISYDDKKGKSHNKKIHII